MARKIAVIHYPRPLYIYGEHGKSLKGTRMAAIILFDKILKFQYGYTRLSELKEEIVRYFFEIKSGKTVKEMCGVYAASIIRISRISLYLGFLSAVLLCRLALKKGMKHASAALQ